jgi:hypothetical protein
MDYKLNLRALRDARQKRKSQGALGLVEPEKHQTWPDEYEFFGPSYRPPVDPNVMPAATLKSFQESQRGSLPEEPAKSFELNIDGLRAARQKRETAKLFPEWSAVKRPVPETTLPSDVLRGGMARRPGDISAQDVLEPGGVIPAPTGAERLAGPVAEEPEVFPPPTEYLRTREGPEVLKEIERRKAKPTRLDSRAGPPWTDQDLFPRRERDYIAEAGIPEIFQGIREMVAPTTPYTQEESDRMAREIPKRLKLALTYYASLGGRLGPRGWDARSKTYITLREDLLRQAEELAGFGPALVPAAGETGTLAIEWGVIYPALFKSVGMSQEAIGRIPRVARATETIKRMGGLNKLAERSPRAYARARNIVVAIEKGAGVGGILAGAETLGKDMEPGDVLMHISKRAALVGGVAGTLQAASEVDTALYIKRLRSALITSSNQRFGGYLKQVGVMPKGPAKSAAYKSLASLKRTELQAIDKIVSQAEAQLLGLKQGKLYQLGQEQVESPQRAAERLMKYGMEPGRPAPKGVEALEKGLGKIQPLIKMPMSRVAEIAETSKLAIEAARHPVKAAQRAVAARRPPTMPKAPPRAVPPRPLIDVEPEIEPEPVKRRAVEILPRKQEILTQIDEAIERAPSEDAIRKQLEKQIKAPELPTTPTEKQYEAWQKIIADRARRISEQVAKIKSQTVRFEIDGGATITNTKEALQTFRDRVKKLPETEMWPKKRPKPAKKKPIAAKRETISELVKAPEGWFTDGRVLVKGKPPARAKRAEDWDKRTPVKIDDVIHAPTEPAEFQHYAVRDPAIGKGISDRPVPHIEEPGGGRALAVFKSGDKYFSYQQDLFNIIRNRYPDLEYGIKADTGLLVGYKGGFPNEPVAALMGITMDEAEGPGAAEPPVKLQPLPKEVAPKPEIEALSDKELKEKYLSAKPTSPEWVAALKEIKRRKLKVPKAKPTAKTAKQEFDDYWAAVGGKPESLEDAVLEYLADADERFKELEDELAEIEETDPLGHTAPHKKVMAQLDKMRADLKAQIQAEEPTPKSEAEFTEQLRKIRGSVSRETALHKWLVENDPEYKSLQGEYGEQALHRHWQIFGEFARKHGIKFSKSIEEVIDRNLAKAKPAEIEQPSLFVGPKVDVERLRAERQERRPEPKEISKVVVDEFREWPKGIRKVGKDFWPEVMAAAKKLLTPYRYKALRRTMLGVFRHKRAEVGGIELQDVRDALTATHELGHNIDWLLKDKSFPSSIKARFPDTEVGEMKLRQEIKNVSKILRPDLWEKPKAYVKKHTELMADFISHYILDPEKTRGLAPNVTTAFEKKLAEKPELFETVSRLQDARYEGPKEAPVAEHIRETFPLPKEFTPLQLIVDMTKEDYVKAAEELGITAARHYKVLMERARRDAERIDSLVPSKARQTDLVVIAEKGTANPWTGKTKEEILAEGLKLDERKAINLFRAYQELARQTVNKYLRGADIAEYIKFIEDYFLHAYQTPLTEKYKTAISKWAKRSPQAKKRVLPDLAKAVELGLKPRAKTLSEGLLLWAGINYRVATNKAFLRILPQIINDDGVSILQKPQDFPSWPTVDYWPIRQTYAVPLPNRGTLLFQGRVAVDPRVKPFVDAMFGYRVFSTPVRIIEGLNATWKAFELTLFSFFHHQAEFFSAIGALGPRAMPFVGGYYGKRAQAFGKKPKLWGFLPAHITTLKAGKQLEKSPEFMEDYLSHGGQTGYISTEGINLMERMLKNAAEYLENIIQTKPTTPLTGVFAAAYVPVKTAQAAYSFHQQLLWDNVQRAKLVAYYNIVADGAKYSDLPMKRVKETAVKYLADNFGGQEWLNTMFRKPKTRQFWTQLMMSLDWTWSQIKTARWPFAYGGKTAQERARRALMRKIGRHHWFWYLAAIAGFTIAGNYAMSGKGPWENEKGHRLDIDWTKIWRSLPWNRDWEARGDYSRRYIGLGKAGRELVRWVSSPLRAFGYKLSPVARSTFEQTTGYNIGSDWAEPWAREDLQLYQELYARFKHLMENFVPFSFSGNNAFLAFPSRKGMTEWKAVRSYEQIYKAKARKATGGIGEAFTKLTQIIAKDEAKLKAEIAAACELNNVDAQKAERTALSGVRSKYYRLFWKATTKPEETAIKECNAYANALLELGIVPKGFKQSLRYRIESLPKEARERGIEIIRKKAAERRQSVNVNVEGLKAARQKAAVRER